MLLFLLLLTLLPLLLLLVLPEAVAVLPSPSPFLTSRCPSFNNSSSSCQFCNSRFPFRNSQFPFRNSRFPFRISQFPFPNMPSIFNLSRNTSCSSRASPSPMFSSSSPILSPCWLLLGWLMSPRSGLVVHVKLRSLGSLKVVRLCPLRGAGVVRRGLGCPRRDRGVLPSPRLCRLFWVLTGL